MEKEIKHLIDAIRNQEMRTIQHLIEQGVDINAIFLDVSEKPVLEGTPLILAAQQGFIGIVKQLLDAKAEVDRMLSDGSTALYHAVSKGHLEIVKQLIEAKADVDVEVIKKEPGDTDYAYTPLSVAAESGYPKIIELLVNARVNINSLLPDSQSALIRAIDKKNESITRQLLEAGASIGKSSDTYYALFNTEGNFFWKQALIAGFSFETIDREILTHVKRNHHALYESITVINNHLATTLCELTKENITHLEAPHVLRAIQYSVLYWRMISITPIGCFLNESQQEISNEENVGNVLKDLLFMTDHLPQEKASNEDLLKDIRKMPNEIIMLIRKAYLENTCMLDLVKEYGLKKKIAQIIAHDTKDPEHLLFHFIQARLGWDWEKAPWKSQTANSRKV